MAGRADRDAPRGDDALVEAVRDLAEPLTDAEGAELVEVEVKGQRNRRLVRLVADADGGLDVDRIARISRAVGDALDQDDVVPGTYTLEVTSPGVDRPLRTGRDFARNLGRDVRIVRREGLDGARELTGTLTGVDEAGLTLNVKGQSRTVPLDEVAHGKVVLPW